MLRKSATSPNNNASGNEACDESSTLRQKKWEQEKTRLMPVWVAKDGLRAFISTPMKPKQKQLTLEDIRQRLAQEEVAFGVNPHQLKRLVPELKMGAEVVRYRVAVGIAPAKGKAGEVRQLIVPELIPGAEQEDGRKEYREMIQIKDQVLPSTSPRIGPRAVALMQEPVGPDTFYAEGGRIRRLSQSAERDQSRPLLG